MEDQNNPFVSPIANDVQTPDMPDWAQPLAGRGTRLVAAIIDGLIHSLVFTAPYIWLLFKLYPGMFNPQSVVDPEMTEQQVADAIAATQPGYLFTMAAVAVSFGLFCLLHGYLLSKYGQTIGKWLLDIKIVRTDGSQPSLGRLLGLRYLPLTLFALVPYVGAVVSGLIDPLLIFRSSRQCLHDTIADTVVHKVA